MIEMYNSWRIAANEFQNEEGISAWDCGLEICRKSFSEMVGREVNFLEMFELEKEWNQKNL